MRHPFRQILLTPNVDRGVDERSKEEHQVQVTEMLVTGYDGEESVFVVNLVSDAATVVFTRTDDGGEAVVDSASRQASDAFVGVRDLLNGLVRASAEASW